MYPVGATYIACPASGIMHAGAHVTHIPAYMRGSDALTFTAMREAGLMCPVCGGNGMVVN